MKNLISDRATARLFLSLSLFSGMSLVTEGLFFKLGLWSILFLALLSFLIAGRFAAKAFPDAGGEMGFQTHWMEPRFEFFIAMVVLVLAFSHSLFYLFEDHGLVMVRNPNLNGDFPFHWHMIKYLERAPTFWPENPVFAGDRLRYAFGTNWLTALALRTGLPFGVVITLPFLFLLYVLWTQLWKWGGFWAIAALFFSGGGWWLAPQEWVSIWGPGDRIAWKNLFLAIFETQRGFWVALPLGLFWLRLLTEMDKTPWAEAYARRRVLFVLWAFLPFFHLHSFVLLTLFGFAFILTGRLRANFTAFIREGVWYLPVPLFFVFSSVSRGNLQSSLRWTTNWMSDSEPLIYSWGKNFGPWLILVVLALLLVISGLRLGGRFVLESQDRRPFYIWAGLGLVFAHLLLAPWAWDQSKLLIWIYLGLSIGLGQILRNVAPRAVVFGLSLMIFLPGLVQFLGGLPPQLKGTELWARADQKSVEVLISMLPVEERVLVAPSPHHPILATGQPLVAGYPGQLWAQGLDISGLEDRIRQLALKPAPQIADNLPKYMIWGPPERRYFSTERPPEESAWKEIKSSGDWLLMSR